MEVVYGADYSAGELSPAELNRFTTYDLRFLIRYIGYPDNPKCISHYPGAYEELTRSGRTVLLVIENEPDDPAGGYDSGMAMARRALEDAASVGYPASLPIFFCADGWLAFTGIPVATAMAYLDGAASVAGRRRVGAYGFRDFIQAAKAGGHAEWLWLCGSAPDDGELAQGWPHFYQWNGGYIYPGSLEADLDWAYPGVLEALQAGDPAPGRFPVQPPPPGPHRPGEPHGQPAPRRPAPCTGPGTAANAAAQAGEHAADAASAAAISRVQADAARAALEGTQAAAQAEPSWIYGMVIGFLGAALLALVVAMAVASLTKGVTISTDVVSVITLIAGGLIGVLAPTPATRRKKP
jgi:Domain of unknown function (DUF1906)